MLEFQEDGTIAGSQNVDEWKCKIPGCTEQVAVTAAGLSAFNAFSKRLVAMGQEPLDCDDVMLCAEHRNQRNERLVVEQERTAESLRQYIKLLGDANTPPHVVLEAERFVRRHAGEDSVKALADRRKAGQRRGL